MRTVPVFLLCLIPAAALCEPPKHDSAPKRNITLCYETFLDPLVVKGANAIVAKIYAGIGVEAKFIYKMRSCPTGSLIVHLHDSTPVNRYPGALGYSEPYEGIHVEVFYDRIVESHDKTMIRTVLAHVVVHESAHLLEAVARHSDEGMMKAHWRNADFAEMRVHSLPFAPIDIQLVQAGIDRRALRTATSNPSTSSRR